MDIICNKCGYWNWEHDKEQAAGCGLVETTDDEALGVLMALGYVSDV